MNFLQKHNKIINNEIPKWYQPEIHAIVPSTIGIVIIVLCSLSISNIHLISFLCVPITIIMLFLFEWIAHKYILHKKQPLLGSIYKSHTFHHMIYTDQNMSMMNKKELYFIMLPPYAIVLVFFLVAPLAFAIGTIFSYNVAYLILITSMLFFLFYEWLHFSYHQSSDSLFGRNKILQRLKRLHQKHHNPELMKHWNFNVTIPIFDWILGTYHK